MAWQRWRQLIGLPSRGVEHARNLGAFLRWRSEVTARQIQAERHLFDRVRREPTPSFPFSPPTPGPDVLGPIERQRRPINYLNLHLPDGTTIPIIPLLRLPLVTPGTWTNDDPGAGSVSWAGCQVAHEGEIFEIDDGDTSDAYIYWDKSVSETAFQTSASKPTIDPTEDLLICFNDVGTAKLAFLSDLVQAGLIVCEQLDTLSANMGILTAGEILLGSGTIGVDFTGIRIYKDGATYRVAGYNNDVLQAYLDSDGVLKAGGGQIALDAEGFRIEADDTNWFRWLTAPEDGGDVVAQMRARYWNTVLKLNRFDIEVVGRYAGAGAGIMHLIAKNQTGSKYASLAMHSTDGITLRDEIEGAKTLAQLSTYEFFPLLEPWVSGSWDGDDKGDTGGTKIDVSASFGHDTTGIVAYSVRISARGSGAGYFMLAPTAAASSDFSVPCRPGGAGVYDDGSGVLPADANGDFWYASSNCDQHWIQIFGYWKMP